MRTVASQLTNPFPGLRPFRSDEHHLFFGREEQTGALLQLLRTNRFLAVVGTSGSGKSSLVRAGMIAELYGGTMTQAGSTWEVMILRPGGSPIENLARAFVEADLYDREDPSTLPRLLATLNRSRFGLVEAMKQCELFEPGTNLLVVVDQFEELFRFRQQGIDSEETAAAFVNLLLTASEQAECPIYVTITMRSDYLGDCSEIPGLAEAVNDGEYLIPRLLRDQKRDAIEKPIGVGGARISPMLVQRLLNDVGDDPDQLPVLQHALMRMWDAWSAGGDHDRPIDFADFEATGGLGEALSNHADEIYDSLPSDRHRSACEKVFKALTVKGDDNRGIRRPTRLAQLQAIAAADRETVTTVLDDYRGPGVTFLMPGSEVELTDRTVIDLSHESLMRGWQRLRMWVEEEAQSARVFRRLLDTARLWSDGKAGLFRDPDLQIAVSWREQEAPNTEWAEQYGGDLETAIGFLETSNAETEARRHAREAARQRELEQARQLAEAQRLRLEQQQRAARRLRLMIAGLAAVAVIAGVACVAALLANQRAITLAVSARQNEEKARQNEEKARQNEVSARQNARRAEESQQETAKALATVASQKREVEGSLSMAEAAERLARDAEEEGRELLYTTDMRLAPFVWRDDRTTAEQLRVLLGKHIPDSKAVVSKDRIAVPVKSDLRGFEWHYYQHLLRESAAVFSGHGDPVVDGAFAANSLLVTLDQNGQLRRWDLSSQAEDEASRRDLPGGPGAQLRVLSPNGRLAALAEGDRVHVFDTSTGDEAFRVDSSSNPSRRLIFSRDGDRLVIVDDTIRWCDAASGEVIASLDQKFGRIESLALSADGLTLAVVGHSNTGQLASIFRLDATAKAATPMAKDFGPGGTLNASALAPDGRRLAVGAKLSGTLLLLDTATGRLIAQHGAAHASPIAAMAFSGDGTKVATADAEGTIKIWADPQKLNSRSTALLTLKGHQGAIRSVGFSMDGGRLITTSADTTARIWDLENAGAAIRPLERAGYSFVARFSPDGQLIASANGKSVRLWDAATGRLVTELPPVAKGSISSVAFSPGDRRLLAVGYGGGTDVSYVALWDIDAGTELARLPGATDLPGFQSDPNSNVVGALAFSPDGKYLVAGFGSKNMLTQAGFRAPLKVWDVASRRLIRRLDGHTNYCVSLDFSRDGTLLASGSRDGTAILWSTATWRVTRTLQNPDKGTIYDGRGMVEAVAFSPDGKTLAMASRERTVHLWDVATGRILETLRGHSSAVLAVAFSPDGRTLASGGTDQTVRLWNVETRRELMQLDPGGVELGQVQSLAFSADGQHLLAGGQGTTFWSGIPIVWTDPDRAAESLRQLLKSNAGFPSRIRMLSENLRLHEALARLDAKDPRVQAALAAAQANWHASRQAWPEAVAAFDRLMAVDSSGARAWLRTPGLLRLATALLHQNRPAVAAGLLQGGARRRDQDGVPTAMDEVGVGVAYAAEGETVRVTELLPGFPGSRAGLVPGDAIVKVNDTELTRESIPKLGELLAGEAGTKVRLTVRHTGSDQPEVIELIRARYVKDTATGDQLYPLRAVVDERLAKEPRNAELLELRAELADQWSDSKARVADYTAAIEALAQRKTEAAAADLKRLYARRGNAHLAARQWQQAVDDYARAVTDATTDDALLSNRALALAEVLLSRRWTVLKPVKAQSELGASFSILPDDSILVGGAHRWKDRYHVELTLGTDINLRAVRLEALTHESLPNHGPGRHPNGSFAQISWNVTATPPSGKGPITLKFDDAWADHQLEGYPIDKNGHWNIYGGHGGNCTAIWSMSRPVSLPAGTTLTFEMQCQTSGDAAENIGHFRLSVSRDRAALEGERIGLEASRFTDPWEKLAAAYQIEGDQRAIDRLVERRPKLAGPVGDLFIQGRDQDKDRRRAIALYSKGITEKATDAGLLSRRARAHEELKDWDAAASDWSRAATLDPDGARLFAEFARRLVVVGRFPLAKAHFEKSEALYTRSLAADPENDVVATDLAQMLLDRQAGEHAARWTILKPAEMKSKGGATLTLQDDGSILAAGVNPPSDEYTVAFVIPEKMEIRSIRLDALTHDSLPGHGPGRATRGTAPGVFELNRWELTVKRPDGADSPRPLSFRAASADHSMNNAPLGLHGEWNISWEAGTNHTSVWSLSDPITLEAGTELRSRMRFNPLPDWSDQNLGRFRLSVSGDPAAFGRQETPLAAMQSTDPGLRLAAAYALNGRNDEASRYFIRAIERADGYEARQAIVELAARFDEVLSALAKRRPDDPQLQLASARKLAERGQRRLAEKQPAKAQAELEKSREILTRLHAESAEPRWTVLKVKEMTSAGGATLTLQDDGSILASGRNTNRDTYTLTAPMAAGTVTGLRLETIPDSRLNGGAGRSYGEFFLSEISVTVEAPNGSSERPLDIKDGFADFSRESHPVARVFDRDPSTSWGIWPRLKERHTAIFGLESSSADEGGNRRLKVRLQSAARDYPQHNLGRFRLSVTNQVGAFRTARLRNDLKDSEFVDVNIALAKAHAQLGNMNGAVASFAEGLSAAGDRAGKARLIAEAAPLAGVLEKLAERAAGDARFQAELARYFAEHGNARLADAARSNARLLFEQKLAQETENPEWAVELAEFLRPPIDARTAMAVPTSENEAVTWRFSTTQPPADWMSEAFDDSAWKTGPGSFGIGSAQGLVLRTEWKTRDIWLRRKFEWKPDPAIQTLLSRVIHDDGFELFINGQQVLSRQDVNSAYTVYPVDAKALGLLKPGINVMAVHCSSTVGYQYIDVGLLGLSSSPHATEQRLTAMKMTDPWAKLAAAYHVIGDQPALDRLLEHHPAAASGVGDMHAANQDWKRALAEYDKAVAGGGKDAGTFADRAEAHERLEHWELAAADWANADLHAVDKLASYGNPSLPALERRAKIHERLQQYDKVVVDANELLKPERLRDNPWMHRLRGDAYDRLRQWQKARADYNRAIMLSSPAERGTFHFYRARHFAAQGQWKQAAKDMQQLYEQPADFRNGAWPRTEWWALRDAALIYAIAGDVENFDRAAAEWYRKQSARTPDADECKWTVLTMLLFPEMITTANRPRLLELAGKTDAYWQPRLTAAIQFRGGDSQEAAKLFDANDPGAQFLFLAALTYHKLDKPDRAKQRLDEGNAWIQEQREKDPGAGVPTLYWLEWAHVVALQYEASESIAGARSHELPERAVGAAQFQAALGRHFAERGNAPLADAARAKARTLYEEKLAKEPENSAWAAELAELLLIHSRAKKSAGGVAPAERFVRLGRKNEANGIDLIDYGADGVTEAAEIEEQQCRLVQTGSRGWGHAYFAIEKGFKWAPSMNVLVEIDYWCDSSGNLQIQYDSHHDFYDKSPAPVPLDGRGVWKTARFALKGARFANSQNGRADFRFLAATAGRFYLKRVSVRRLTADDVADDPWLKLAAAYQVIGDQQALDRLLKRHPEAASVIGDLYADAQDWERAIAEYRKRVTDQRADVALLTKLATAYESAGRTREAILPLAQASAANPKDTILSLKVAALQAWFGQEKELAATRQRVRTFAKDTKEASTAERAAKVCSILPTTDKAELDAALALSRAAVKLGKAGEWNLMALGIAEYRSGNDAVADRTLLAAVQPGPNNPNVMGTSAFFRAMSLFRQGKKDEARKLALAAAAQMKPPPKDQRNPLADGADHDELILWLAYKETKAMIHFDAAPASPETPDGK